MLALLIIDCLMVLGFLLVGAVVILKDSRALLNRLFFGFVITVSIWIIANFLSNDQSINRALVLAANHITLFMPGVVLLFLINFSLTIAGQKIHLKRWLAFNIMSICAFALSLTSLVFTTIHKQGAVYAIDFRPLSIVYFLALLVSMMTVIVVLVRGRLRATGERRQSLTVILWGLSAMLGINVATNALLPALGGSFALTNIGPISGVFVIYALWYSIVRHRLFDIRLLIARSLGYVLSLASIGFIFAVAAFVLTSLIFRGKINDVTTLKWVFAGLAAVLAFIFAPLKQFFDRVTNRIFYRDAYDPQAFLDELNKTLINNIELGILLRHSAKVIEDHLRCEHVTFVLYGEENPNGRFIGSKGNVVPFKNMPRIREGITKSKQPVVVYDSLTKDTGALKSTLRDNGIALIAGLQTDKLEGKMATAYLSLGGKKTGNTYNNLDLRIIEIIVNELVIAIQNALRFEEIQNFNFTLQKRIDEATHKLRNANVKLQQLDETKDDFISMASHQLRTPLTSVKGYLSMVLEGDAGKVTPMQKEMLSQAFFSSQRMVYIIADLLNVSRLKTGKFIIEPVKINLADVIQQELEQVEEMAEAKQLTLQYDKPKDFPELMLDDTKTRQVIMNFVDNAIYYTPNGGHITVRLIDKPGTIELRVEDNGMGVPKHEQPHLFTKFYRAGNARKARPDGTGLGLFMAKKVIVAQGGSILFESQEGKGSTFGFVFGKSRLLPTTTAAPSVSSVTTQAK